MADKPKSNGSAEDGLSCVFDAIERWLMLQIARIDALAEEERRKAAKKAKKADAKAKASAAVTPAKGMPSSRLNEATLDSL